MTIIVTLAVEVDPQEWATVYGTDGTAAATRKDVRDYMFYQCQQSTGALESGATVDLR